MENSSEHPRENFGEELVAGSNFRLVAPSLPSASPSVTAGPGWDASWPFHVVEENCDLAPIAITTVLGWFYLKSFLYRSASVSDGEVHQGPAF